MSITIRALTAVFSMLLLASACQYAAAETAADPAPSPAACLSRTPGSADKPEYPDEQLELRKGETVPIQLVFTKPDRAPEIIATNPNSAYDFVDAVKSFARNYRLPCMKTDDKPIHLKQEYYFNPFDSRKVIRSAMTDAADEADKAKIACITNGEHHLSYPTAALEKEESGNFLIEMTFSDPDKGPTVKWLASTSSTVLKRAVENYVSYYRMPCVGDQPVVTPLSFQFHIEGGDAIVIQDMTLKQFVTSSKSIPRPVKFDLNTMQCPFDVRITYQRPYLKSDVYELETTDPARKPLLDWLALLTLDLNSQQSNMVLGESFNLSIPCGKVDL